MRKDKQFENILNDCLERLSRGEALEACLAEYPERAKEIRPLLEMALAARRASDIVPRPEFRERASREFQEAIRELKPARSRGFIFNFKPVWVTAVALVVLLIAGGGTVYAASNSLPDSPLYQVKLATEQVRLTFTFSDIGKAELYARFADERIDEIVKMAEKGNLEQIERTTERMNDQLLAMADLVISGGAADRMLEAQSGATMAPMATPSPSPPSLSVPSGAKTTDIPTAAPMPTPAPTVVPAPAPVVTVPPATSTGTPEVTSLGLASMNVGGETNIDDDSPEAALKRILSRQSEENARILLELIEQVPEELRPALIRALEVATNGYAVILDFLAQQ